MTLACVAWVEVVSLQLRRAQLIEEIESMTISFIRV